MLPTLLRHKLRMVRQTEAFVPVSIDHQALIAHLNEDLSREYQAIIAHGVYSQTLRGAEFIRITNGLESHAALSELAVSEDDREILIPEQEPQMNSTTARSESVPDVSSGRG